MIPPAGITKLTKTRNLLHLQGQDAPKFLQGATTSNIPALVSSFSNHSGVGAYTAFLSAQGRVLFDTFIYPIIPPHTSAEDPTFLIEHDAALTQQFLAHICRYKLRSKFSVRAVEPGEWDVWSSWGYGVSEKLCCEDPRAPGFGNRIVVSNGQKPLLTDCDGGVAEADEKVYRVRRMLWGIPEGRREIVPANALPLESNLDYMNAVDFHKGCYVGQELTIRTRHRGVVRKRILPAILYPMDCEAPQQLVYCDNGGDVNADFLLPGSSIEGGPKGRSAGKWLAGVGNIGLALCRLEVMVEDDKHLEQRFTIQWNSGEEKEPHRSGGCGVKAFVPQWHKAINNQT
jgi:folate-binding protein YgfZ